jgi:pullulanase/glycogen debranching enzyme
VLLELPLRKSIKHLCLIALSITFLHAGIQSAGIQSMAMAQEGITASITADERLAGFRHREGTTWFIFDASVYGVEAPKRVSVTGQFRGWSQDMQESRWLLQPTTDPKLWILQLPNQNYERIAPSSPFKFRIDQGTWMQPPNAATNRESGNLVFAPGIAPIRLKVEIRTRNTLWARLSGNGAVRSLSTSDYELYEGDPSSGNHRRVPIAQILPNTASESLICLAEDIDIRRLYYLHYKPHSIRSLCRRDGWYRTLYSDKPLGAQIAPDGSSTSIRLFAPRADRVGLYLYKDAADTPANAWKTMDMTKDPHGVWEVTLPGDYHGIYYDFTVHGAVEKGNKFHASHPVHISDPYARVSLDSFGKGRIWRATKPAPGLRGGRPAMKDVVAYEVHIQDFTSELPVEESMRGTIPGMIIRGLKNSRGKPIGFDHLVDLGINVVHLMPVQEFLHYPDSEWQTAFRDDPYMQSQGVHLENYDWGYRTTHAFAIESRYRRKGTEPGAEREQFRDLVAAFHERGIAVIVDIVPNHTGENMDGREYLFNFGAIDTDYYYRTNEELEHIGPYGNEVKFEDRPMVQRWLIDQCRDLIEEFGIDGFRIDLAGQVDKQTLIKLREEMGEDVIIYGEPWIAPSDPEVAKSTDWGWYKKDAPITFFQDDARNAFKGPTSNPVDKKTSRGFAGGDATMRGQTMKALLNDFSDEKHPAMGINYLDIHDNWTLADQFAAKEWDGRSGVDEGPYRIAAGLLMTSLGPIVLHGGSEFLRSKGAAGLEERVLRTASGPLAYHGKGDTYNVKTPNLFLWENVGRGPDKDNSSDHALMQSFWRGLIALRQSEVGELFRIADPPPPDYFDWIAPDNGNLLGYMVAKRLLVLINSSESPAVFPAIPMPQGTWKLICDGKRVDHARGLESDEARVRGNAKFTPRIPAETIKIWLRQD